MDFRSVYESYVPALKEVEQSLRDLFASNASLIPAIGQHILAGGGKRIRPLFLLAAADLFGYRGDRRIVMAGIIEAIHTASLLHDDVVDAAAVRRGRPTAHSLWGNQVVVLVGDFLYANALRASVFQRSQLIMEHLSTATTRMTEGELLQLSKTADPDITEQDYLSIIAGKTGSLISAACSIGAILGGATGPQVDALAEFGLKTGMVFQMVDDILDYSAEQQAFGKKLGKDLEEGKITLPLILLMQEARKDEKDQLRELITAETREPGGDLKAIFELFDRYGIMEKSMERATRLVHEAQRCLDVLGDAYDTRRLRILAEYAMARNT